MELHEHLMKVFEGVIDKYTKEAVNIEMQFGFMPGHVQEMFLTKIKDLYLPLLISSGGEMGTETGWS